MAKTTKTIPSPTTPGQVKISLTDGDLSSSTIPQLSVKPKLGQAANQLVLDEKELLQDKIVLEKLPEALEATAMGDVLMAQASVPTSGAATTAAAVIPAATTASTGFSGMSGLGLLAAAAGVLGAAPVAGGGSPPPPASDTTAPTITSVVYNNTNNTITIIGTELSAISPTGVDLSYLYNGSRTSPYHFSNADATRMTGSTSTSISYQLTADASNTIERSALFGDNTDDKLRVDVSLTDAAGNTLATGSETVVRFDWTGTDNADTFFGSSGNDILRGGLGADTLTGGLGADKFVFTDTTNSDTITDFNSGGGGNQDVLVFDISSLGLNSSDFSTSGGVNVINASSATNLNSNAAQNHIIIDTAANIKAMVDSDSAWVGAALAIESDTGNVLFDSDADFSSGAVQIGSITQDQVSSIHSVNLEFIA
jgi:Ca2+-binding RTX toxin-like protein